MFRIRYAKTIASCAALAVAALLVTLVLTHTGPAKPRPAPRPTDTPTATEVTREAIKPGNYATAINIHNPNYNNDDLLRVINTDGNTPPPGTVKLYKKAVIARYEGLDKLPPSTFVPDSLASDYAMEVDCTNIWKFLSKELGGSTPFTKGFVVILAKGPLDVFGVYTAEPPTVTIASPPSGAAEQMTPGIALEMLRIDPRIVTYPGGPVVPSGRYYEYSAKFLCGNTQALSD